MQEGLPNPDIVPIAQKGRFRLNYDIKTHSRLEEDCKEKLVSCDKNGPTSRRRDGAMRLTCLPAWYQEVRSDSGKPR